MTIVFYAGWLAGLLTAFAILPLPRRRPRHRWERERFDLNPALRRRNP